MLSKLRIDLDHDNMPILTLQLEDSQDVRDKMANRFFQGLFTEKNKGLCIVEWYASHNMPITLAIRPLNMRDLTQYPVQSIIDDAKRLHAELFPDIKKSEV